MKKILSLIVLLSGILSVEAFAQTKVTPERIHVSIATVTRVGVEASKDTRSPIEQKMSSQLLELRAQHASYGNTFKPKGMTTEAVGQQSMAEVDLNERVHLYVRVAKSQPVDAFVKALEAKAIIIAAWNNFSPVIEVWATVPEMNTVASMPAVTNIDLVLPPIHNTGPVNSEGDSRVHADVARAVMSATGSGIKVGVMSDDCGSTENLVAPRIANGELGAGTTVLDDSKPSGRTHEGLAMMEIVQDLAPLARLYFATASTGEVQFANNIQNLATAGCKVITDDIIYLDEPVFEDGIVAQAVNTVATNNGVIYTSAAANQAQNSYFGVFNPLANQPVGNSGNKTVHNFGGGVYQLPLLIGGNATAQVTLHWDDQYGASGNDYDLYLVNSANNNTLASSTGAQNGAGTPLEYLAYTNPGGGTIQVYLIAVRKATSVGDPNPTARIKFTAYGQVLVNGIGTATSSTFGHSAALGCISAGAIDQGVNNYNTIESFSNQGPVYMIDFTVGAGGGGRGVLSTRTKPDVASIDGVTTSVTGFTNFHGTSAATPHVAGIAAQLMSLYPSITPAAAKTAIQNGCIDYGAAGTDNVFGAGRTDAFRTIALYRQSLDPSRYTANFATPATTITDNSPAGITSTLSLAPTTSSMHPSSIYVSTTIDGHPKIGELKFTLKSPDNTTITLMNQPVSGAGNATGKNPNIVFGDNATNSVQTTNLSSSTEEVGFYVPASVISSSAGFGSHALGGTWTLTVSDNAAGNVGTLKDWGIYAVQAPNVLIVDAANASWVSEVQTKLLATGQFTAVDIFNGFSGTPTLAQLNGYKAVLAFTDGSYIDPAAMGNVLASYVDGGGGVVASVFIQNYSGYLTGNWSSTYQVIVPLGQASGNELTLEAVQLPAHPIMNGISTFDGGTSSYKTTSTTLTSGSYEIARYSDGSFLIDAKENVSTNNARRADLDFYPPSTDSRSDFWKANTDGAKIITNALLWVAGYGVAGFGPAASVSLTAPVGGESWCPGSTQNITWTSSGITNVKLEISTDGGTTYSTIIASTAAAGGTYAWTIPANQTPGNNNKVRISDASNPATNSVSPSAFTMTQPASATVSLSPSVISIANQSMQTITATITPSGGCSPSFQLLSVTSSDADNGTFTGDLSGDINAATGTAATTFQVRAERIPNGSGRFYTVTYRLFEGSTAMGDYVRKVAVLENGGFVTPNVAGSCGLQLAGSIPDFTGATLTIPYTLTSAGTVKLSVYSLYGKELSRLLNNVSLGSGAGSVIWNGTNTYGFAPGSLLPNGTYVLVFTGCGGSDSRVFTINH